ncbi:MAG: sigma-70 family RNA polymerase sigma factor [Ferruginibacter sp.]
MSYSDIDDIQLIQLLRNENDAAFAEIYNRYWKLLYTTAYNIIQDQFYAQEAVQEVFISLWRRRQDADIQELKAYMQQAVRFQILKTIRTQKNDQAFYKRFSAVTAGIFYENPLLFKEQQALLTEILNSLPGDCGVIFKLSREENLTYAQIASQLNISVKTVEKKMTICLKHIRKALEQNNILVAAILMTLNFRIH